MAKREYLISEIATMFDISSRTIRYYEEIGLIRSEQRGQSSQQRVFADSQRRRLKLILRGKRLGFRLEEIREMVDLYENNPTGEMEKRRILEYSDRKLQEIEEKIIDLETIKVEILAHRQRLLNE